MLVVRDAGAVGPQLVELEAQLVDGARVRVAQLPQQPHVRQRRVEVATHAGVAVAQRLGERDTDRRHALGLEALVVRHVVAAARVRDAPRRGAVRRELRRQLRRRRRLDEAPNHESQSLVREESMDGVTRERVGGRGRGRGRQVELLNASAVAQGRQLAAVALLQPREHGQHRRVPRGLIEHDEWD